MRRRIAIPDNPANRLPFTWSGDLSSSNRHPRREGSTIRQNSSSSDDGASGGLISSMISPNLSLKSLEVLISSDQAP
jgi:hypothetical protein